MSRELGCFLLGLCFGPLLLRAIRETVDHRRAARHQARCAQERDRQPRDTWAGLDGQRTYYPRVATDDDELASFVNFAEVDPRRDVIRH